MLFETKIDWAKLEKQFFTTKKIQNKTVGNHFFENENKKNESPQKKKGAPKRSKNTFEIKTFHFYGPKNCNIAKDLKKQSFITARNFPETIGNQY